MILPNVEYFPEIETVNDLYHFIVNSDGDSMDDFLERFGNKQIFVESEE